MSAIQTNESGTREAIRRLAILAEWGISPPPQHWCPEAEQYDLNRLIADLQDDEKVARTVEGSGKGLSSWFYKALGVEAP